MSANLKRLDLRFGSFACSVQGFDNPVEPVQLVLRAIQHLLEETPELSEAGISFDADTIDTLIEEVARRADLASEDIEITPGLVIVHRGENDRPKDFSNEVEAFSRSVSDDEGAAAAGSAQDSADESGKPGYVNIFASSGDGPSDVSDFDDVALPLDDDVQFEDARPKNAGLNSPPRDIFADAGSAAEGNGGGSVFADPMAAAQAARPADLGDSGGEPDQTDPPQNLFMTDLEDSPGAGQSDPDSNIFSDFEMTSRMEDGETDDAVGELAIDDIPLRLGAEHQQDGDQHGEGRVQALFGDTDDQPETVDEAGGYTVAGLAQASAASNVPDMMVSAAAWMVLLQGQSTFSRREVMDAFDQIPGDHKKTLEARIKGFGMAVRNGHLIMIEDGVFGLAQRDLDRFQALL